ncbi:MAG: sugar ABC transporter substrate-binding protein, partial [Oscillospiraceae bacterium]
MRRIIATIMTLILTISCLASCGTKPEGVEPEAESKGKDLISIYSGIANGEASKNVDRNTFKVGELSKKYTFGYVAGNLGSAYFYVGPNATKDYLESLGCTCLISDANADLATQVSQIENFITQAVDAIIINSVDPPSGVSEALQKAAEAGIPVVAVDSFLSDEFTNYLAFVGSDNFKLGYECGVYAANYMLKTKGAVEGKVCVLDGVEGNAAATGRYDGFWAGVESVAPEHKLEEVSRLYGGGWTEEAG